MKREELVKNINNLKAKVNEKNKELERLERDLSAYDEGYDPSWVPKYAEKYFFIDDNGLIKYSNWTGCAIDFSKQSIGNVFPSEIVAEKELRKIKLKLNLLIYKNNFDTDTDVSHRYFINFKSLSIVEEDEDIDNGGVYFFNFNIAETALDKYKDEIKDLYGNL